MSKKIEDQLDKLSFPDILFHTACLLSVLGTLRPIVKMFCEGISHRSYRGFEMLPFALIILTAGFIADYLGKKFKFAASSPPRFHKILMIFYCAAFSVFLIMTVLIIKRNTLSVLYAFVLYSIALNSILYIIVIMFRLLRKRQEKEDKP